MHVLLATDGSPQSLDAARHLRSFADRGAVTEVTVIAVVKPMAAVAFADEIGGRESGEEMTFRMAAQRATEKVAAELQGWGPEVSTVVWTGSPAREIVRAAEELGAGLVVVASGGSGVSDSVLLGSTATRVMSYAPCPVMVVRRPRARRRPGR